MNNQKLLSICIPTFNRSKYLKKCLDSLSKQLNPEYEKLIEVVICDNCSNDGTYEVVSNFIAKNSNFSIIYKKNKTNIGAEKNLILTTILAKGYYVWFMGDDDIFVDNAISKIIPYLKEKKFYFIMLNKKVCDKNLKNVIIDKQLKIKSNIEYKNVVEICKKFGYLTNLGFISTSVFNRKCFINVNPEQYYNSRYPQCGVFLEAFCDKKSLVLSDIFVVQRQGNQTEDIISLFPLMASVYIIKTFRILIEKQILTINDIKQIRETYLGKDSIILLSSVIDWMEILTKNETLLTFKDWENIYYIFSNLNNNFFNKRLALSYGNFLNYSKNFELKQIDYNLFLLILNNLVNVFFNNYFDLDILVVIMLHLELVEFNFSSKIFELLKKMPNIYFWVFREKYSENLSATKQNNIDIKFKQIVKLIEMISKNYNLTLGFDHFTATNMKIRKLLCNKNIVIFGASKSGEKCLREIIINEGNAIAFLDNKYPNDKLFNGLRVYKPKAEVFKLFGSVDLIILASNGYKSEMRKQLDQFDLDIKIIDDTELYY